MIRYYTPTTNASTWYLPSGGVIDFNAADVTITHSANTLTFAGASAGYVFNGGPTLTLASVVTKSTTGNVSAAEMSRTLIQVTGAATISLPTAAPGYEALIVSTTAAAVSVDVVTGTDVIILDGTALTAGNKITSDSSDEASVYVCATAAGVYRAYTVQGVWVDGGA